MQKASKNIYKEILAIGAGFLVLYLLARKPVVKQVFLYIGISIPILSLISPLIAEKIVWGYNKITHGLGYINSRIILSIVFFIFLTPIALLARMRKGDMLRLKKSGDSYFTLRNHQYMKGDLEKLW